MLSADTMWNQLVAIVLLASAPARADTLFSAGLGAFREPMRWTGPGELDPSELRLSTTGSGVAIPLHLTVTQDQREPRAFGVVIGFTPCFCGAKLAQSTMFPVLLVDVLARMTVVRTASWGLHVGGGAALEQPLGGGTNGVLSNDNVEPFTTLYGGVAAVSLTYFGTTHDYTFDLRAGVVGSEHMRAYPILLTASLEWGRSR